ncbi:MAG: flagellar basal body-associated FliL family protein [Pseudomonadota bacterium]|mgnify:CR=1 FL=1
MNKKVIIFALLGVVLLAGTVVGTLFLAKTYLIPPAPSAGAAVGHAAAPAPVAKVEATYKTIDPAFVVNIQDGPRFRFLQVEVDVMTRDTTAFARLDKVIPRVKSELTMLFGSLQRESVQTVEGQKALQAKALEVINAVLKEETGKEGIAAVYFTKFVVQ